MNPYFNVRHIFASWLKPFFILYIHHPELKFGAGVRGSNNRSIIGHLCPTPRFIVGLKNKKCPLKQGHFSLHRN
jgi:hypothetical protein